jgi:osmotically inducible lipoprotein OsmB
MRSPALGTEGIASTILRKRSDTQLRSVLFTPAGTSPESRRCEIQKRLSTSPNMLLPPEAPTASNHEQKTFGGVPMHRFLAVAALSAAVSMLSACGTSDRPLDRAGGGAAVGAGTGAAIGAIFGGVGAIPGALIGAAVGGGTGYVTDERTVDLGKPVWQ